MDASKHSADSRTLRLEATPAQIRGRILVTSPGRQAKLGRYCRYADHPLALEPRLLSQSLWRLPPGYHSRHSRLL